MLKGVKVSGKYVYDPGDVARLKWARLRLNVFDDWVVSTDKAAAYTEKAVGGLLGLSYRAVSTWAEDGLLVFYDLMPPGLSKVALRMYLRPYIDGLVRYSPTFPVTREVARSYRELCARARRIVVPESR